MGVSAADVSSLIGLGSAGGEVGYVFIGRVVRL